MSAGGLAGAIAGGCMPLPPPGDDGFAAIADHWADCRVLMLGEASHGTAEFYQARAAITRRMIERHGARIVAVEADWPDAVVLDRHVRSLPPRDGAAEPFQRFPRWMWRNAQVTGLVDWMRDWNWGRDPADQVGFHGLDMYNLSASIRAVLDYWREPTPRPPLSRASVMVAWSPGPNSPPPMVALRDQAITAANRGWSSNAASCCPKPWKGATRWMRRRTPGWSHPPNAITG